MIADTRKLFFLSEIRSIKEIFYNKFADNNESVDACMSNLQFVVEDAIRCATIQR